jgi:type VI secretion system protein ImpE
MPNPATARRWFEQGEVRKAQEELSLYLRDHPADIAQRTFLFELLCFSGAFERAEKQLAVLAQGNPQAEMGAVLYYSALHAEKTRHDLLERFAVPNPPSSASPSGRLNGQAFRSLRDGDPDFGSRLEVFAAGVYLLVPFEHIASVEMAAPQRLRDTLWMPALLRMGPTFQGRELGEVLIPVVYPFSWKHANESVWLGRVTDWVEDEQGREYLSGQRTLLMDDEEIPFLEVRSMEFTASEAATPAAAD